MPVKGQMNKTRTAKSKGKGLNLKWWYVLPVIAIVAVAGYLVIRYSQAGRIAYIRVTGNGLRGGFSSSQVPGFSGQSRIINGFAVSASVGAKGYFDPSILNKKVCAEVYVGNVKGRPASWHMSITSGEKIPAVVGSIGEITRTYQKTTKTYTGKNQTMTRCIKLTKKGPLGSPKYADVIIMNGPVGQPYGKAEPLVGVNKVYLQE